MKHARLILVIAFLTGCGLTPVDQLNKGNGSNTNTPPFSNFSTHTTITGNLATAVKPVGGFVSSVVNSDLISFTTTVDRGTFTTATILSVPVGTAVTYEVVTDTSTNLVIGKLLRSGNTTALVTQVLSLQ